MASDARAWGDLGRDFGAGPTEREGVYLRDHEWARTAEDVFRRRSKLGLHMTSDQITAFTRWSQGDHSQVILRRTDAPDVGYGWKADGGRLD